MLFICTSGPKMLVKKAKKTKKASDPNKSKPTVITQYIRKAGREPRGVMAAVSNGEVFSLGFSLVNRAAGDKFDKKRGMQQAIKRAERNLKSGDVSIIVPPSILASMQHFATRAQGYFKDKKAVFTEVIAQSADLTQAERAELKDIFTPDFAANLMASLKENDVKKLPSTLVNIINRP